MTCVASVLSSIPEDCELIVVDNASSEGNADAIATNFPAATLIRADRNLGFAGGCNLGSRRARGEYLVFLNPDTVVEGEWLKSLLAPFEGDETIGLVTSRILLLSHPDRINTCGCDIHITGLTLCRGMGQPRDSYPRLGEVGAVSGAAFAIRHDRFDQIGGFDEDMFLYFEDIDLSWRARLAGWTILYAPDSVVLHDYTLKITPLKIYWQERNRYLMLLKSFRWRTLVALLPAYLLAEVIAWSFVLLKDRIHIRNKLRAYRWVIENWREIMRKRKRTQLLRSVRDREMLKKMSFRIDFDQASAGWAGPLARFTFNPVFFVLRSAYLALVWW
jgi:GT2 family glycosyltransferase